MLFLSLQVTGPHTIPRWGEDALPGQAVTFSKPLAIRDTGQGQEKVTNLDRQEWMPKAH